MRNPEIWLRKPAVPIEKPERRERKLIPAIFPEPSTPERIPVPSLPKTPEPVKVPAIIK